MRNSNLFGDGSNKGDVEICFADAIYLNTDTCYNENPRAAVCVMILEIIYSGADAGQGGTKKMIRRRYRANCREWMPAVITLKINFLVSRS